jgi:hypothetical protein
VKDTVKIHEVLTEKKGLQMIVEFAPDIPEYMIGDPERLRQILNNLIGNAIKFTDEGQIKISVEKIDASEQKIQLAFSVSDTGIGIAAEKMDLLFKRFTQVDGSATRRHNGTGLGLAICKQLVELMGGTITASSEIGKGSTFRFTAFFTVIGNEAAAGLQSSNIEVKRALPPILMDDKQTEGLISARITNLYDQVIVRDNLDSTEKCSRVRLNEEGEIVFAGGAEQINDRDATLLKFEQELVYLQSLVKDNRFSLVEESAHKIKKLAIKLNADDLMELAFKIELAARKSKWDAIKKYCLVMINLFDLRYKEA